MFLSYPLQSDPLRERDLHGQDPQQGLGPVPGKKIQSQRDLHTVCMCVCVCVFVMETTLNRSSIGWRLGMDCSFVNNERSARNAFQDLDLFFSN